MIEMEILIKPTHLMVLMIIYPYQAQIAYQFKLVFHHLSGFIWMEVDVIREFMKILMAQHQVVDMH